MSEQLTEEQQAAQARDAAAAPAAGSPEPRTFTQDDVDRIVAERVRRVKATPPDDYDDLKAAAQKLAEIEERDKSELEKALARAEAAEKKAQQVEADGREMRLRSAILAEAAKAERKVVDPEAVVALLDRSELELDDSGFPTNIAKAMDSLLEKRPYLVAAAGSRGSADQGARAGASKQLGEDAFEGMTAEEIVQAQQEGRFESLGIAK